MPVQTNTPAPLSDLRGQNRVLLVSAPEAWPPQAGAAQAQLDLVDVPGFKDRDMVVVYVDGEDARLIEFDPDNRETHFEHAAGDLRSQLNLPEGRFTVRLLGKDGTEKAAFDAPIEASELFDRIDDMPMRQREMRDQGE